MKNLDILNAYLQRFYPTHINPGHTDASGHWNYRGDGWEYSGPDHGQRIFPLVLCANGLRMSVQGHYGAYSYPRDDFSDEYKQFEVRTPIADRTLRQAWGDQFKHGERFDGWKQYAYVPLDVMLKVIEMNGGLFDWHKADLGGLHWLDKYRTAPFGNPAMKIVPTT